MPLRYIKKIAALEMAVIFFLTVDRLLKFLSINGKFDNPIDLISNFLKLNFIGNKNIAFSIPFNGFWLNLLIISIIIILLYTLLSTLKQKKAIDAFFLSLIIAGAISNLADRLQYRFVIDYLDLKYFTIFNVADSMICVGAFGLIFWMMKKD